MQESGEMYLETILVLSRKGTPVRSLDVARELCVSRPSVSRAMAILKNGKYVLIDEQGYITLSESGLKIAEKIYERHIVLSKFLMNMGVSEETAEKDACRIEHIISDDAFDKIKSHIKDKDQNR